ncbi:hypothetical protein F5Y03DRAFT_203364 [Xylaria venustula]|nr:hypothetical protein F5Y03DRAFT_203364 [Xylaria venustula]
MSTPSQTDHYSTLEVATDADVLRQGRYPEVATDADVRHGQYPEVVPPSIPEAYGYYDPPKPEGTVRQPENDKLLPLAAQVPVPSTAQSYASYPEVVDGTNTAGAGGSKGRRICGLPAKWFWVTVVAATIAVIIAAVVGGVVGSMKDHTAASSTGDGANSSPDGGDSGSSSNSSSGAAKATLYNNTQLASAVFVDTYNTTNLLVVYQLSDGSIRLSAFNSSNTEWVVTTIINGTDGVKLGTSLAIDTFWEGDASPDVNLYYQGDGSATTIMSLTYPSKQQISTLTKAPAKNWQQVAPVSGFNSMPGSNLVAYGKQCDYCNQYGYFFWQGQNGLYMAENDGSGFEDADLIDVDIAPSTNTSLALTFSGTSEGDDEAVLRRSIDIFYRSTTSALTQLRIGNGMNVPQAVGRDIGPQTNIAAFSVGINDTDTDTPIGFQVLSIDPEANDGVQLTYLKDSEWTASEDTVDDLSDCQAKARMSAHSGYLFCLVDSGGDTGLEIIEYAWQGDSTDEDTYINWEKKGSVDFRVT